MRTTGTAGPPAKAADGHAVVRERELIANIGAG
jgi:hypothetical protein